MMQSAMTTKVKRPMWSESDSIDLVDRLSEGFTVREIAKEFNRTMHAVQSRIQYLMDKHRCYTQAHLVATFMRLKLIE